MLTYANYNRKLTTCDYRKQITLNLFAIRLSFPFSCPLAFETFL